MKLKGSELVQARKQISHKELNNLANKLRIQSNNISEMFSEDDYEEFDDSIHEILDDIDDIRKLMIKHLKVVI